jgi:hypothetical protein
MKLQNSLLHFKRAIGVRGCLFDGLGAMLFFNGEIERINIRCVNIGRTREAREFFAFTAIVLAGISISLSFQPDVKHLDW